jgi:hypothetical protein
MEPVSTALEKTLAYVSCVLVFATSPGGGALDANSLSA